MSLPTSYMTGNYSKIQKYFEVILNAQAPEKFTVKFLKDLGFTSSADTQFINILKSLGFLDDSGTPNDSYFRLLDRSVTKTLVADGIKSSYADLFALNVNAQNMDRNELKGKFKTLTQGQKSDSVINQMVSTFIALCEYADWTTRPAEESLSDVGEQPEAGANRSISDVSTVVAEIPKGKVDLNYDIHIHLPATRDERVYEALFASLVKYIPVNGAK